MQRLELVEDLPRHERQWPGPIAAVAMVGGFSLLNYLIFRVDLLAFGFFIVAVSALGLMLVDWPFGAFIALVISSLIPIFTVRIFAWHAKAEDFVAPLVALAIAGQVVIFHRRVHLRMLDWLLIVLIGLNFLSSYINSPQPGATLKWALQFTLTAISYFVVVQLVVNRGNLHKALNIFLILGATEVLFGVLCYISYLVAGTRLGIAFFSYLENAPGVMGSLWEPNIFGGFSAALAVMFLLYRVTSESRHGWYSLGFLLASIALLLSLARQGWIAFAAGLLFLFWYQVSRNKVSFPKVFALAAIVLLISVGLGFLAAQNDVYLQRRLETMTHPMQEYTFNQRVYHGLMALQHVREHPWLGWGTNSFSLFWNWQTDEGVAPAWLGNLELRVLHDTGVIGLIILTIFLAKLLRDGFVALKSAADPSSIRDTAALLAGLIVLLVAFQATDATTLAFPWIYMGLLAAATRLVPAKSGADGFVQ